MSLIRKGDVVQVIAGNDRYIRDERTNEKIPVRGEVLEVQPSRGKLVVKDVNVRIRHEKIRASKDGGQAGGRVSTEMPVDASNVMFYHKDRPVRLGTKVKEDGTKVRVVRGGPYNGEEVDG
jgi:large subunit ribosomal protein L24